MTNLQTTSMVESGTPLSERIFYGLLAPVMAQDVNMGVLPQLYGSTAPDAKGAASSTGQRLCACGYPAEQKCNDACRGCRSAQSLREASEELTGVRYLD